MTVSIVTGKASMPLIAAEYTFVSISISFTVIFGGFLIRSLPESLVSVITLVTDINCLTGLIENHKPGSARDTCPYHQRIGLGVEIPPP